MTVLQIRHKPEKKARVYVPEAHDKRFTAPVKREGILSFRRIKNT